MSVQAERLPIVHAWRLVGQFELGLTKMSHGSDMLEKLPSDDRDPVLTIPLPGTPSISCDLLPMLLTCTRFTSPFSCSDPEENKQSNGLSSTTGVQAVSPLACTT